MIIKKSKIEILNVKHLISRDISLIKMALHCIHKYLGAGWTLKIPILPVYGGKKLFSRGT